MSDYSFLLASSTNFGSLVAASLIRAGFQCRGVLTPAPKKIGRRQILTPNPVEIWARQTATPITYVSQKIEPALNNKLPSVDFLFVVDFGYYIPSWLITWPKILSINLHPSALPQYRGASPGQFVLKNGDQTSAMSIMTLAQQMDAGDLLAQIPFAVKPDWNAADYYQYAFNLVTQGQSPILATTIRDFVAGKITLQPQRGVPTLAPKIDKTDTFVAWEKLKAAQNTEPQLAQALERQIRAFSPKPLTWTWAPTTKGKKRLQLLRAHLATTPGSTKPKYLVLDQVKLEGETAKPFINLQSRLID
jgi:methionyl-tRNA formyltransferase